MGDDEGRLPRRIWRWFVTGIDPRIAAEVPAGPDDIAAFHTHNRHHTMIRIRGLTAVLLFFNWAFWLTDDWLLGHVAGIQPALSQGRAGATVLGLGIFAASFVPRRLQVVFCWVAGASVCGVVAWTLGRVDVPGLPWFDHINVFMMMPLIPWIRPFHRVIATVALMGVVVAAYFGANPDLMSDPLAGSTVGNVVFIAMLSIAIGFYVDRVRLRLFLFRRATAHAADTLAEQVEVQTKRIKGLLHHVETVREDERRELAAELHDEMGQTLTGMRCILEVARQRDAGSSKVAADLEMLVELLQRATWTTRDLLARLRPPILDDLGLDAAAEWLVQRTGDLPDIGCELRLDDADAVHAVPADRATVAFRVMQASLTNVVRHARASRAEVALWVDDGMLRVTVEDDGVGFDPDARSAGSMGLSSMAERARALGGWVAIESAPGCGTRIDLSLPIGEMA